MQQHQHDEASAQQMHDIRESQPYDIAAIEGLYPDAFPDEDLLPLVTHLLGEPTGVLSLVATDGKSVVGHVAFTTCSIADVPAKVALLGPLAVATARQKQGIGTALVREGIKRMAAADASHIYVLGDPAYYARFGFTAETGVAPPYPLPEEWRGAWQSLSLGDSGKSGKGTLSVPKPWRDATLWGPSAA